MKLFLLTPVKKWDPWYDRAFGFVVRAGNETLARTLASAHAGQEGHEVWKNPELTKCEELTTRGESRVILRNFASA